MPDSNVLIYVMRRDLRVSDNPILHHLAKDQKHGFTHLLPLYVFSAAQIETKGFIEDENVKSPYPDALSPVGGFPRCGPHRAQFLVESVWDVKEGLESVGSGLCVRVGTVEDVVKKMLKEMASKNDVKVGALWMVGEEGVEENREERFVQDACRDADVDFKLWEDEKYFIDDRDIPLTSIQELSDVFTTYRKTVEPLRESPRDTLPKPAKDSLPAYPSSSVPTQHAPFTMPDNFEAVKKNFMKILDTDDIIASPPSYPSGTQNAHPFKGGEVPAQERLDHLITSGAISTYNATRNGLLGLDFSTKLSAYLALGSITARQIHSSLLALEDGSNSAFASAAGYGAGENEGTKSVRFELLWRDYMRLCTRKFDSRLFQLHGFKNSPSQSGTWHSPSNPSPSQSGNDIKTTIERFLNGTTGMGLIDASMRELYLTGYTSNRARQNVASFFAKHLRLDWRIGAEYFECMLVDYDLSSNWGNWQYIAGVGNDPRGEARIFNPVKQGWDYDPNGEYVRAWVEETRELRDVGEVLQTWTVKEDKRQAVGLQGNIGAEKPLLRIEFTVGRRGRNNAGRAKTGATRGGVAQQSRNFGTVPNGDAAYQQKTQQHNQNGYARGGGYSNGNGGGYHGGGYHGNGYAGGGGGGRWNANGRGGGNVRGHGAYRGQRPGDMGRMGMMDRVNAEYAQQ